MYIFLAASCQIFGQVDFRAHPDHPLLGEARYTLLVGESFIDSGGRLKWRFRVGGCKKGWNCMIGVPLLQSVPQYTQAAVRRLGLTVETANPTS